MGERRQIRDAALAALDAEIALRRSELACLERARDTIERGDVRCDGVGARGRACSALVHTALCRVCGFVARRCSAHGGRGAASALLRHHEQEHGVGWPDSAATDDSSGVLSGGEALPVGFVSPPSSRHGEWLEPAVEPSERSETPESRRPSNGA
jgi:hypothetical protein